MRHVHLLFAFPRNIKQMSFCKCQKAKGHQSCPYGQRRLEAGWAGWQVNECELETPIERTDMLRLSVGPTAYPSCEGISYHMDATTTTGLC
jgi:hypothetical protein